jgi:arylsulfatase A
LILSAAGFAIDLRAIRGFYQGEILAMFRFKLIVLFLATVLGVPRAQATPASGNPTPLNIVLILVDDLGWTDLSCMGSKFYETPHIDRLAAGGMKFTQAYSACTVCSPSRAAVLTGRYPARLHLTDWISGHVRPRAKLKVPEWTQHLEHGETTLAEALGARGYISASIGKWHLGGEAFHPETQGFKLNVGGYFRGQPPSYFAPYKIPTLQEGPDGEFLTDREAAEAVAFIKSNRDRPFFLYLPHYAVHTPIQAKKDAIARYQAKAIPGTGQSNATYASLIESVDESVGRITQTLEDLGLTERTLVIFTSDNGGLLPITSNAPLRAGKGSAYEGGVRVPLIVRWPGVTEAGSVNASPVMSIDFFPTLMEAVGSTDSAGQVDGESLVPLLSSKGSLKRTNLFWHYPHYHPGGATPYGAVRQGDTKLIEHYEDGHLEMFDLANDPGEKLNIANQFPAKRNALAALLGNWREQLNAQMPSTNPDFDPYREKTPSWVVQPRSDASIELHSRDASVHGAMLRYEPQPHKNTLGYWVNANDSAHWDFQVNRAGSYRVEILQGCGPGSGGSRVAFQSGSQSLEIDVIATKGFQDFLKRDIGSLHFDAPGRYSLDVKPLKKPGAAVMDLRQVRLIPSGE